MIMDRYEEALERAKTLYGNSVSDNAILEHIFPELAESEDERIRKALICGLSEGLSDHNWQDFGGATIDECIAWLEKQKEQKPPRLTEEGQELLTRAKRCWDEAAAERLSEIGYVIMPKAEFDKLQHPAEWSEEDEKEFENLTSLLDIIQGSSNLKPGVANHYRSWLKSLRPQPHWKPSEEQMEALRVVLEHKAERMGSSYELSLANSLYEQLKAL